MSKNRHVLTVEKVQNAIVDAAVASTQLVNTVSQQIGFRPSQLMPKLRQATDADNAFGERPSLPLPQFQEPIEGRNRSVVVLEEDYLRPWHGWHLRQVYRKIAIMSKPAT
jgi:hypothetical protein